MVNLADGIISGMMRDTPHGLKPRRLLVSIYSRYPCGYLRRATNKFDPIWPVSRRRRFVESDRITQLDWDTILSFTVNILRPSLSWATTYIQFGRYRVRGLKTASLHRDVPLVCVNPIQEQV